MIILNVRSSNKATSFLISRINLVVFFIFSKTGIFDFKRPELVEKMNDIIAKHYLGMLAK